MHIKSKLITEIFWQVSMVLFVSCLFSTPSFAGKLGDFEKDATTERHEKKTEKPEKKTVRYEEKTDDDQIDSCIGSCIGSCLGEIIRETIGYGLYLGGKESFKRVNGYGPGIQKRAEGEPTIPFFRADYNYQDVDSDVHAWDLRLEAGYAAFGFQFRNTRYKESSPNDELNVYQYLGLFRISGSEKWESDLALGALTIAGNNNNSGFSLSCPVQFHPYKLVGFHFRPSWSWINGNSIGDYDLGIILTYKYVSLQSGYRWFKSANAALNGPYVGISAHY